MCSVSGEMVWYIDAECQKLAQHDCKKRHGNVARMISREFCGNHGLQGAKPWSQQTAEGVSENEDCKT